MRLAVALSAIVVAHGAPQKKADPSHPGCGEMACTLFTSEAKAFAAVLEAHPSILAIGEVHQTNATSKIRSAIKRFTESMLPLLKHKASDLIAETWVAEGKCGEEEEQAVADIRETTERPAETEDEVLTLLKKVRALQILPHILAVPCEEYRRLLDEKRELDSEKLLELVTGLMRDKARLLFEKNQRHGSKRIVVIYGGAIHNDAQPREGLESFSFGHDLDAATDGRYVELDLIVPELIAGDDEYKKEPWYPELERNVSTSKALLIRVRPTSFVIVFPKGK
jgi:hypothetical protein